MASNQSRDLLKPKQIIDRTAGLACLYGSQVIPPGDAKSSDMITLFEKAMYERKAGAKAKIC